MSFEGALAATAGGGEAVWWRRGTEVQESPRVKAVRNEVRERGDGEVSLAAEDGGREDGSERCHLENEGRVGGGRGMEKKL